MILNEVCKEQQKKIEQNEEKKEEKKEEKISEDKCRVCKDEELSPAFKVALAAAISGSFKAMADLKEQGYKPSSEDIKALKEAGPKVCIAAQTIFNIKSENAFAVAAAPQNKKEDKQLTLNF